MTTFRSLLFVVWPTWMWLAMAAATELDTTTNSLKHLDNTVLWQPATLPPLLSAPESSPWPKSGNILPPTPAVWGELATAPLPPATPENSNSSPSASPTPEQIDADQAETLNALQINSTATTHTGQFVAPGTLVLVNAYSYASLGLGGQILSNTLYATVAPQMAMYENTWSMAWYVPLALTTYTLKGQQLVYDQLRVRREDWQSIGDYLQVIRFLTFANPKLPILLRVSSIEPVSLGHGMLVNHYQASIGVGKSNTSAMVYGHTPYLVAQVGLNDVTLNNRLLYTSVSIKPARFSKNPWLRTSSVNIEYIADLKAPQCILGQHGCILGVGNVAGADKYTGVLKDTTFVNSNAQTGLYNVSTTSVQALGIAWQNNLAIQKFPNSLQAYAAWHGFLNAGGGEAFSLGSVGHWQLGERWLSTFDLQAEYRTFGDGFLPSYFDLAYEANKYEFNTTQEIYQVTPTKYQVVFGDAEHGFVRPTWGRRHGYKVYGQWALHHGSLEGRRIAVAMGLEDSTGPNDSSLLLHVAIPAFHSVQVFASYFHLNEHAFADLFTSATSANRNNIALTGLRWRILPIAWISANYQYSFAIAQSPGTEYHLGNAHVLGPQNQPNTVFRHSYLFNTTSTLNIQLELGWEF